ncbi:hypothetical protein AB1N83_010995 [Pleurotus pulmonarius]
MAIYDEVNWTNVQVGESGSGILYVPLLMRISAEDKRLNKNGCKRGGLFWCQEMCQLSRKPPCVAHMQTSPNTSSRPSIRLRVLPTGIPSDSLKATWIQLLDSVETIHFQLQTYSRCPRRRPARRGGHIYVQFLGGLAKYGPGHGMFINQSQTSPDMSRSSRAIKWGIITST